MKRILIMMALISLLATSVVESVFASAPYEAYTYNYYEEPVPLPAPFLPERSITGNDLGVGSFKDPNDIFITKDKQIYILDSGNNRIICLDSNWKPVRVISSFNNNGVEDKFASPSGIAVTDAGLIYIADTDHNRIVMLTTEGFFVKIVENPQSEILPANFKFIPVKLTVDRAGRIFVVARSVFEGLMQFDEKGNFLGYVGTINVQPSLADRIWRKLATKTQRSKMQLFIPTEFSNVDIDDKGFVYSTNIDMYTEKPIKRLNPSGEDVIKRFGFYPNKGDIMYRLRGPESGPSRLLDIKVIGGGMYTVIDNLRGRLFTYNDEGELLYAFGGRGTQLGVFTNPVAVERYNDKLVVLDRSKSNIVLFEPTEFGKAVHLATTYHYEGDNERSVEMWKEVIKINTNYDIAYIGIGKSLLMEKKNKEAMEYFKLGMQRKYYSIAFKRYRKEVLQQHFGTILTVFVSLIIAFVAYRIVKSWRSRRGGNREAGTL